MHDQFTDSVAHGMDYVVQNRQKFLPIVGGVVALLVLAGGFFFWQKSQGDVRQRALQDALDIQNAGVGQAANSYTETFPTEEAKATAAAKAFKDLAAKYSGTNEGAIGHYYLGVQAADKGNLAEAESHLRDAEKGGNEETVSLAKSVLADVLVAQGKSAEAEKVLNELIAKPSALVSKEQATVSLARIVAKRDLAKARALLEPMRGNANPTVSRAATSVLGELQAGAAQ